MSAVVLLGPRAWQGAPSATRTVSPLRAYVERAPARPSGLIGRTLDARCATRPLRVLRKACVGRAPARLSGLETRTLDAIAGVPLLGPRAW